jgi:hypothetical protein
MRFTRSNLYLLLFSFSVFALTAFVVNSIASVRFPQ